jgi:hypothetical protein
VGGTTPLDHTSTRICKELGAFLDPRPTGLRPRGPRSTDAEAGARADAEIDAEADAEIDAESDAESNAETDAEADAETDDREARFAPL